MYELTKTKTNSLYIQSSHCYVLQAIKCHL